MKRVGIGFGLLLALLALTGCAGVTPTGGAFQKTEVQSGKSKVIVLRLPSTLYADKLPAVQFDDQFVGFLPNGGFLEIDTTPGPHSISLVQHQEFARRWKWKPITFQANLIQGKTYFYEMDITMENFKTILLASRWDDKVSIRPVTEEKAMQTLPSLQKTLPTDK